MDYPVRTLDEMRAWSVSRSLPHDQAKVWEALTDREAMRRWSSVDLVGPRSMGAHITLAVEAEAPENGVILAFERPRLYSYSSAGERSSGKSFHDEPRGSRLTLSVTLDGEVPRAGGRGRVASAPARTGVATGRARRGSCRPTRRFPQGVNVGLSFPAFFT